MTKKVLIVEDNELNREIALELLGQMGVRNFHILTPDIDERSDRPLPPDRLVETITPSLQSTFPELSVQILPAVSVFVFCIVVALFIALEPRGINHRFERFKLNYRMHPF